MKYPYFLHRFNAIKIAGKPDIRYNQMKCSLLYFSKSRCSCRRCGDAKPSVD